MPEREIIMFCFDNAEVFYTPIFSAYHSAFCPSEPSKIILPNSLFSFSVFGLVLQGFNQFSNPCMVKHLVCSFRFCRCYMQLFSDCCIGQDLPKLKFKITPYVN